MANSTFSMWLSTAMEYSVIQRQFEVEMDGIFAKLPRHQNFFAVSVAEIETLASLRSIEMWFRYRSLKKARCESLDPDIEKKMIGGDWYTANVLLDQVKDENTEEHQKNYMRHLLIQHVYVVDTQSDISFL